VRVCFYAAVKDSSLLSLIEFYRQDLEVLEQLGHSVRIAMRPGQLRGDDDLYWVWWPTSGAPAVLWSKLRRRPSVLVTALSTYDLTASGYRAKPPWTKAAARLAVRLADLTLASSEEAARGTRPLRPRALRSAPLAVDVERHFPRPGSPRKDPYVLTVSQLSADNFERKRLLDVVRTAAAAREAGSNLRFVIAGDWGPGAPRLQREIRAQGLEGRVVLTGRVTTEKKVELMQGASVYLQPTNYEAFGLAIVEAMACGLPVVSHAVGSVPEVVGDAGHLLPPGAGGRELARSAIDLAGPEGRILGRMGRDRAVGLFSTAARRRRVADAIRTVSARSGAAPRRRTSR
jgi:glycosyltransferase involved in cell wall biosynthesis